ncbi:hypothetical protein ACJJTC_016593 [Scirpophaga incertulas]
MSVRKSRKASYPWRANQGSLHRLAIEARENIRRAVAQGKEITLHWIKAKKYCTGTETRCSHCGGQHTQVECSERKEGVTPKCINCTNAGSTETAHNAFSACCPVRRKWDSIARARVAYC